MNFIQKYLNEHYLQIGDILVNSTGGGTVGRTGYVDSYVFEDYDKFVVDSHVTVVRPFHEICNNYIYFSLISPQIQIGVEERCSGSTNQIELGTNTISNYLVPLPPIGEQVRIAQKLAEVIPQIDTYDKEYLKRGLLNEQINISLKKSILQEAIQGRLVSQCSEDEPASALLQRIKAEKERLIKEKKIKRDKAESVIFRGDDNCYFEKLSDGTVQKLEIPFDIPESWEWVRLRDLCVYLHRGKSPKYGSKKQFPIIAQKCNQWDKVYTDKCLFSDIEFIQKYPQENFLEVDDIIVNSTGGGTVGRTGYVDSYIFKEYDKFVVDSHVTLIRTYKDLESRYIYYYLISPYIQNGLEDRCSGSTNQIELGSKTIANYLVPLPPFAEQKRIVERIIALFQHLK